MDILDVVVVGFSAFSITFVVGSCVGAKVGFRVVVVVGVGVLVVVVVVLVGRFMVGFTTTKGCASGMGQTFSEASVVLGVGACVGLGVGATVAGLGFIVGALVTTGARVVGFGVGRGVVVLLVAACKNDDYKI